MNKKNKILVGCLALLLTLSAGYALFSDTITINGTATAKGSFDMTATCEPGLSSKLETLKSLGLPKEGGYENDTCSVVDDTASYSTKLLYPGARRYFTIKITNSGTINAVYNFSDESVSEEICELDELGNKLNCSTNGFRIQYGPNSFDTLSSVSSASFIGIELVDGTIYTAADEEIMDYIDVDNGIVVIEPNESIYVLASVEWWDRYGNGGYDTSGNYSFSSTATFDFSQEVTN